MSNPLEIGSLAEIECAIAEKLQLREIGLLAEIECAIAEKLQLRELVLHWLVAVLPKNEKEFGYRVSSFNAMVAYFQATPGCAHYRLFSILGEMYIVHYYEKSKIVFVLKKVIE